MNCDIREHHLAKYEDECVDPATIKHSGLWLCEMHYKILCDLEACCIWTRYEKKQ